MAENVEIMQQYMTPQLATRIEAVAASLRKVTQTAKASVFDPKAGPVRDGPPANVTAVQNARQALLRFLTLEALLGTPDKARPGVPGKLEEVYQLMTSQSFAEALALLTGVAPVGGPELDNALIETALTTNVLRYNIRRRIIIDGDFPGPNEPFVNETHSLPGYKGQDFDAAQRDQLFLLRELLLRHARTAKPRPEHAFRFGLLRAECHGRLGNPAAAIAIYADLILNVPLGLDRRRDIALRSAHAHLALGDQMFRRTRDFNAADGQRAIVEYEAARTAALSALPSDDPALAEISSYVEMQQSKIAGHFNFIGLTDGFVPLETTDFLAARTRERIDAARNAGRSFEDFLSKANALDDLARELQQEIATADPILAQAQERFGIAGEQIRDADEQLAALEDQQDALEAESVVDGFFSVLEFAASSVAAAETGDVTGPIRAMRGLASTVMTYNARSAEIGHQKVRVEIAGRIAEREQRIAALERLIVTARREFVRSKLDTTQGRDLNRELYYTLAGVYRELAERQLDEALRFAYSWERAIAFRFRKPELKVIPHFDPMLRATSTTFNVIAGADLVNELAIALASAEALPGEFDTSDITISLREQFPIEFNQFRQTGELTFPISLYDLDKLLPGTYDRRILAVAVQPIGLLPATGYTGTLTHPGTFLLRDLLSTPDPTLDPTARLVPTEAEVTAAFEQLPEGALSNRPVRGVVAVRLDRDIKQLSPATENLKPNDDPDQVATRKLFERYGPATSWRLRLDMNTQLIADVLLKFRLQFPETNEVLRRKVLQLITRFERQESGNDLDEITVISMRRSRFNDAFRQMEGGAATFTLDAKDFNPTLSGLKVKTVIVQALDRNEKGVAGFRFVLEKDGAAFTLDRTTGATGFSEGVDGDLPVLDAQARFPLLGSWRLRLPDPGQFQNLGDLVLFFAYEVQKPGSQSRHASDGLRSSATSVARLATSLNPASEPIRSR